MSSIKTSRGSVLSRIRGSLSLKKLLFKEMTDSVIPLHLLPIFIFKSYYPSFLILMSAISWSVLFKYVNFNDYTFPVVLSIIFNILLLLILILNRVESVFNNDNSFKKVFKDSIGLYANNFKSNFKAHNKLSLNACKILSQELSSEELKILLSQETSYEDLEIEKLTELLFENEKKLIEENKNKTKEEKTNMFVDSLYK